MATSRPVTIQCARCKREAVKETALAEGWLIVQKAAGSRGDLHILCNLCRNRSKAEPSATLDVQEAAPFNLAKRQARPKRGKRASH